MTSETTEGAPDSLGEEKGLEKVWVESGLAEPAARILRVAMSFFATKGFAATSVREIVQQARVTNPMVYYYFDSKEGVFTHLMNALFSLREERMLSILSDMESSFVQKLYAIVEMHREGITQEPTALRFIYSVMFGPSEGRPSFDPVAKHTSLLTKLMELFDHAVESGEFVPMEGGDALFFAQQFFGLINQHMMQSLNAIDFELGCDQCSIWSEDHSERIVRFFLHGASRVSSAS